MNAPVRFVSITACHCSSDMRATSPSRAIPALFTRIVTLAERALDLAERGVDGVRVGHVGLHGDGLGAFGFHCGLRLAGAVGIGAVANADRVTRACECDGDRATDAPRRAGDEGDAFDLGSLAHDAPQRRSALPQVRPAPTPEHNTRSPSRTRPSSTASNSASGIDADDVLP